MLVIIIIIIILIIIIIINTYILLKNDNYIQFQQTLIESVLQKKVHLHQKYEYFLDKLSLSNKSKIYFRQWRRDRDWLQVKYFLHLIMNNSKRIFLNFHIHVVNRF